MPNSRAKPVTESVSPSTPSTTCWEAGSTFTQRLRAVSAGATGASRSCGLITGCGSDSGSGLGSGFSPQRTTDKTVVQTGVQFLAATIFGVYIQPHQKRDIVYISIRTLSILTCKLGSGDLTGTRFGAYIHPH